MRARNPLVSVSIDTSTRRCLGCQTRNFHIPRLRGIRPAETRVDPPLQTTAFHLHPFAAALQNFESRPLRKRSNDRASQRRC